MKKRVWLDDSAKHIFAEVWTQKDCKPWFNVRIHDGDQSVYFGGYKKSIGVLRKMRDALDAVIKEFDDETK